MIIFDLDGTLADCEHRRHFVQRHIACDHWHQIPNHPVDMCDACKKKHREWKPDWQAFYEACAQDKPIEPVIRLFYKFWNHVDPNNVSIWSARCESVRDKTIAWLVENIPDISHFKPEKFFDHILKMRPIGDNTPDDQLKEKWMLQYVYEANIKQNNPKPIDFVFDDRPKVIRMWRKYGIFVFNCCQHDGEF